MLEAIRNKIEMNRDLIELINKIRPVNGNYWNKFSENCERINNLTENYYCYFIADLWCSGNFKTLL